MANEIYQKRGTSLVWDQAATNEDLDLASLAADGTRIGSYYDRGDLSTTPAPDEWQFVMFIDGWTTSAIVGETVDLYFAQSDATTTDWDGEVTAPSDTVDGAGPTVNTLKNLMYAGSAVMISTTITDECTARGVVRFTGRYFAPVVHNNGSTALANVSTHKLTMTPIYYQAQ